MSDITWSLQTRKLAGLKFYEKNPRSLSIDQANHLQQSIDKFGLIDKPIINLDNVIIGGHQRVRTLKKMGIKECECHVPNRLLEPKEVEELNIRHNRTGSWDWDILGNEFEVPDLIDWGFSIEELQLSLDEKNDEKQEEKIECKCPTCGKKMKK